MVEGVCYWPITVKAQLRSQASPCEFCGTQNGTGTSFRLSAVSIIPPMLYIHFHLHSDLHHDDKRPNPGDFQNSVPFRKSGSVEKKTTLNPSS